jgi:hypothetical protein
MEEVLSVKPLCILFCRASSKGLHFESQTFSNIFSKVRERPFNLKGGGGYVFFLKKKYSELHNAVQQNSEKYKQLRNLRQE